MAVTILGGLVTYVLVALVVLPALYLMSMAGRGPAHPEDPGAGPATAAVTPSDAR